MAALPVPVAPATSTSKASVESVLDIPLDIPDFFAYTILLILRAATLTSLIGLILLPFLPSSSKKEHIVWVIPVYSVLIIHRLITYVSQLICTLCTNDAN